MTPKTPIEQLAPCERCGSTDCCAEPWTNWNSGPGWFCSCDGCGHALMPHKSKATAIYAWNRRASPQHPEGTVEAVARALCVAEGRNPEDTTWWHNNGISEPYGPVWMQYTDAARAALSAMPGVSDGWKLAQVEPTEAMLNGARDWSIKKNGMGVGNDQATGCWSAMLSAAPTPPEKDTKR